MSMLPAEFADLEPFAEAWCLPTEPERSREAARRSMAEMQEFYDAISPRAEAASSPTCDAFPLDAMPEASTNLLHLVYSMIQVSFPVECWLQPRVPDTGSATFDCVVEPVP